MKLNVLVVGGSGYLGQFLVQQLASVHNVAYTYHTHPLPADTFPATAHLLDVTSSKDYAALLQKLAPLHAVINCAAISQPAVCEQDYAKAAAINVPKALLDAVQALPADQPHPYIIHISTDQVYDGSRANWKETDPTEPVNAYGRSKLAAEQLLQQQYYTPAGNADTDTSGSSSSSKGGGFAILRSSLIYGPQPPAPVGRPLFLQFVDQQLKDKAPTSFFVDEYRCPIYVKDIYNIAEQLLAAYPAGPPHAVYNMGGPQRLSRLDMAQAVADHRGYDREGINSSRSADVQRGYNSPPDISMDMSQLLADLPQIKLTPFAEAIKDILV